MTSTTSTTNTPSALDNLITSLSATIQNLSDEVNRTYADFVLKDKNYTDALAYEAELDRQRLEKMADGDAYNADKLSDILRNTARPNRANADIARTNALNAWNIAKDNLQTEKGKLSGAEKQLLDAKIAESAALANVNVASANAQANAINQDANSKLFSQKNTQYLIIGGIVIAVFIVGVYVWKRLF